MVVAFASKGIDVSPHFGHSDGCYVYYIENQQITAEKYIENPLMKPEGGLSCYHMGSHKNGVCSCRFFATFLLHETQMDVIVTGEIGIIASKLLSQRGINVIAGIKGEIGEYLQKYVRKVG